MSAKYWEIRESYGEKGHKSEVKEAYECGYEEGYEAAMEEMESGKMGQRSHYGMREDTDTMGERRGRGSMGRYR